MSEKSSIQTKRNRKQYCTSKLSSSHVFNVKIEKFVGGKSRQSFAFPVSGMLGAGNNRNDHFRYFLGVHVHSIEVSA